MDNISRLSPPPVQTPARQVTGALPQLHRHLRGDILRYGHTDYHEHGRQPHRARLFQRPAKDRPGNARLPRHVLLHQPRCLRGRVPDHRRSPPAGILRRHRRGLCQHLFNLICYIECIHIFIHHFRTDVPCPTKINLSSVYEQEAANHHRRAHSRQRLH